MGIYSERVWYGGANARRVDELWERKEDERLEKLEREEKRMSRRKNGSGSGGSVRGGNGRGGRRSEVMKMHSDAGVERIYSSAGRGGGRGDERGARRSRTMV